MIERHVYGFFDTDLHEVIWHFATHEGLMSYKFNWWSKYQCKRNNSNELLFWFRSFKANTATKYTQTASKVSDCPRRSMTAHFLVRYWSRRWFSLTRFAKLVGVATTSYVLTAKSCFQTTLYWNVFLMAQWMMNQRWLSSRRIIRTPKHSLMESQPSAQWYRMMNIWPTSLPFGGLSAARPLRGH